MASRLLIIVPCYQEQDILAQSFNQLHTYLQSLKELGILDDSSAICMVNDGSRDRTWEIIEDLVKHHPHTRGIQLSKNFGHQAAILAGLQHYINEFDCYITIDADLQDDVTAIRMMVERFQAGAAIVYGVRNDRQSDSWFKRTSAEGFYRLMQKMGVPVIFNHADFRLIDNRVLQELNQYQEVNLFLRGIIPTIGFQSDQVFYKRLERQAGESKYPLSKMLIFAWNGITSFSTVPMRLVLWFGIVNFMVALGIGLYALASLFFSYTVPGWTSTILPMVFFSGSNMVAIGLIGEYIGKIYQEIKGRPRYIIDKHIE